MSLPFWRSTDHYPPRGYFNYAYYLNHPWKYLEYLYYHTKWFIQRGIRGYADNDVWDWNSYMARINSSALRWLADRKDGNPCGMTMKGWRNRLLRMADGFQAFIDYENDSTFCRRLKHRSYSALLRKRKHRLAKGLRLYSEHFESLWD